MARKLAAIRTAGVTAPTPLRRLRAAPDVRKLDDEFTAFERYRMESSEAVPKSKIMVQVVPSPPQAGQLSPGKTWESLEKRIDELGQSIGQIADGLRTQLDASLAPSEETPGLAALVLLTERLPETHSTNQIAELVCVNQ